MSIHNTIQDAIEQKLTAAFSPQSLKIINESHLHSGHAHHGSQHNETYDGTGETHFRVIIVAEAFKNMNRVERHRAINDALKSELNNGIHALALEPSAPGEPTRR